MKTKEGYLGIGGEQARRERKKIWGTVGKKWIEIKYNNSYVWKHHNESITLCKLKHN